MGIAVVHVVGTDRRGFISSGMQEAQSLMYGLRIFRTLNAQSHECGLCIFTKQGRGSLAILSGLERRTHRGLVRAFLEHEFPIGN